MGKKAAYICIILLVAVTVVALVAGVYTYTSQNKYSEEKTVTVDGETKTELEVELKEFVPGSREFYEIKLKGNRGSKFDVSMNFEKLKTDSLAKYIDVEIFVDGKKVDGNSLDVYLEGKSTEFEVDFSDEEIKTVSIVYEMGLDVGDEAQEKSADFKVVLTSKR